MMMQETLIVWSEGENCDYALSFQEKKGCDEVWEKICQVDNETFFVFLGLSHLDSYWRHYAFKSA